MKNFILPLISILVFASVAPSSVFAADFGLALGQSTDSSTMDSSTANSVTSGAVIGAIAIGEISGSFKFRSGLLYHSRSYGNTVGGTDYSYSFNYAEIPAGLLWQISEYGGIYAGANIGLNVSSNCSPGTCTGLASTPVSAQFGFQGKFHPNFGGTIYYETSPALVSRLVSESSFGVLLNIFFY